jgi:hypothetical protein
LLYALAKAQVGGLRAFGANPPELLIDFGLDETGEISQRTRGQVNAVRAAFKAGIKPSLIARQFGISQSDAKKVLASESRTRS